MESWGWITQPASHSVDYRWTRSWTQAGLVPESYYRFTKMLQWSNGLNTQKQFHQMEYTAIIKIELYRNAY